MGLGEAVGVAEVGAAEVGGAEVGGAEVGGAEVGGADVGGAEVGAVEVGAIEVGSTVVEVEGDGCVLVGKAVGRAVGIEVGRATPSQPVSVSSRPAASRDPIQRAVLGMSDSAPLLPC